MTPDPDDALSWEGDEDLSRPSARLPQGWNAVGKGSEAVEHAEAADSASPAADAVAEPAPSDDDTPAGVSTSALLGLGVLGGVYLLYTVGWVVGGLRLQPLSRFLVADAMYLPWLILAIAAPALWFLTAWVLTRGKSGWIRMVALITGALLLVPWPFVMVGVIGS